MHQPREPYAGPADDGGDQGSFTVPSDSFVAPNAANPEDRSSAGSHWSAGVDERKSKNAHAHPWQSAMFTLLTLVVMGSVFMLLTYCSVPR